MFPIRVWLERHNVAGVRPLVCFVKVFWQDVDGLLAFHGIAHRVGLFFSEEQPSRRQYCFLVGPTSSRPFRLHNF